MMSWWIFVILELLALHSFFQNFHPWMSHECEWNLMNLSEIPLNHPWVIMIVFWGLSN